MGSGEESLEGFDIGEMFFRQNSGSKRLRGVVGQYRTASLDQDLTFIIAFIDEVDTCA
jgi:hypothetical protein